MTAAAVLTTALAQRRERPGADLAGSAPDLVAAGGHAVLEHGPDGPTP